MRLFAVVFVWLFVLVVSAGAVIGVQQVKATNNSGAACNSVSLTLTSTLAGSIIVVAVQSQIATPTITDSASDTFTDSGKGNIVGNVSSSRMGAFLSASTGVTSVSGSFSGATFCEIVAWEVTGLTSATFDKVVEAGGTSATMSSGSTGTLSSANEIGIGYLISQAGATANTAGSGWTSDLGSCPSTCGITPNSNYAEHIVVSSTAAITATASQASNPFDAWAVTLQGAAAATCGSLALLGVGC